MGVMVDFTKERFSARMPDEDHTEWWPTLYGSPVERISLADEASLSRAVVARWNAIPDAIKAIREAPTTTESALRAHEILLQALHTD